MGSMQELIPFAREILSQRPSRGLLKVYLLGSVLAVLGTVIGLLENVCQPFSYGETMDAEMVLMLAREQRTMERQCSMGGKEEEDEKLVHENGAATQNMNLVQSHRLSQRSMANRPHAS
ncbi:G0/G1 switch protein 2 [Notothenia coriiceps]|uniref:G0/G1 switch protein 2 n=1 Tax=Notothenia coriiceps TaxID=8208 RepID=A0A6I9N3H0_9TELE|nr:PREDICTED: G0/G1 switch protein 2 [Notothenia coriiceps]